MTGDLRVPSCNGEVDAVQVGQQELGVNTGSGLLIGIRSVSKGKAGLPGKDGSSFVRLTMTAHHDDGNVILSLSKDPLSPNPLPAQPLTRRYDLFLRSTSGISSPIIRVLTI